MKMPLTWARRLVPAVLVLVIASVLAIISSGGGKTAGTVAHPQPYSPGPEGEESLKRLDQYWHDRLTYPTGRFRSQWVIDALKQAKKIETGVPGGLQQYRQSADGRTAAKVVIPPFRSLGPQPQESTGCQAPCFTFGLVSGRVSAFAFNPNTTIPGAITAYLASDGGGIWKSTNCCTPTTTWSVTTDSTAGSASVTTTAVDDVTVDPANPSTVYAATGDISFGSFAFGSAGVLKSMDAGATWTAYGTSEFAPPYLQPGGGTYPQYQAVTKVRVDPNNSNKVVVGTKTGLFFSYNAGVNWTGPCLTNNFSSQRQDVTDLILRDDGTTTTVFAAIGARGFATTVQQNLGLNGANGVYRLTGIPASGCPFVGNWSALTNGWPGGTAAGVACDPPVGDNVLTCSELANVVPNPGFETDCAGVPCNWTAGAGATAATDTAVKHAGLASLKLTSATSPAQAMSTCLTSFPVSTYDASFWYNIAAAGGAAVTSVSLEPHFFSSASCTGDIGNTPVTVAAPTKDGTWQKASGRFTPPAGTNSAQFLLKFTCAAAACGAAQTANFDDVSVDRANKVGRIEMAIAPSNPQIMYAEVQAIDPHTPCGALQVLGETTARGCYLGLWRTSNGGNTWTQQSDFEDLNPLTAPTAGPCGEDTPQMWYDMGVAVDPANPDALFLDMIDIWKSTDGGATLTDVSCGYYTGLNPISAPIHVDNHALAYAPNSSSTLLAGNDGGAYVSNNAANVPVGTPLTVANPPTFTDINKTLSTIEFYGGDISQNFANQPNSFIVGGAQDNGSSFYQFGATSDCPPAGCQWSQRIGGDGFYARIEPKMGQRVFMESQNGNLQRSTSGPAGPYQPAAGGWTGERLSFIFPYEIDKFACPGATCDRMIAGSYRVWESIDGASTWYPNSPDLTKGTLGDRSFINQLAYAYTTNGNAIVGTNDGNVQYGFGMGTGTADTATWIDLTGGNAILPNRPIQDVVISPNNPLVGYAAVGGFDQNTSGTPGHVFRVACTTFCASFTWANKTGNLPNIPVNSIIVNPNAARQVYAGTDWGLYFTDDITAASPVWKHVSFDVGTPAGLPPTMIWDMSIDRGATTLVVFTRSRGAWAWPLPTQSATEVGLFNDTFEGGGPPAPADNAGWVTSGTQANCPWHDGTPDNHTASGSHSWTTEPYPNNCNSDLTTPGIAIPVGYETIRLTFWEHHETEAGTACGGVCDYGIVQMSIDGGPFVSISGRFEGGTPVDTFAPVSMPLSNSLAGHTIKVRFKFVSDATVSSPPHEGWTIDDVALRAEPAPSTGVTVSSFAARNAGGAVSVRWRTGSEVGTLGFNVWRLDGRKPVKVNRTLVAARGGTKGAVYRVVDRAARPGSHVYRLQSVSTAGKRRWLATTRLRVTR